MGVKADKQRGRHTGGSNGEEGLGSVLSLVFFFVALTQVSADMPGAYPGVDYNIKTTTGKTRSRAEKEEGSERTGQTQKETERTGLSSRFCSTFRPPLRLNLTKSQRLLQSFINENKETALPSNIYLAERAMR